MESCTQLFLNKNFTKPFLPEAPNFRFPDCGTHSVNCMKLTISDIVLSRANYLFKWLLQNNIQGELSG